MRRISGPQSREQIRSPGRSPPAPRCPMPLCLSPVAFGTASRLIPLQRAVIAPVQCTRAGGPWPRGAATVGGMTMSSIIQLNVLSVLLPSSAERTRTVVRVGCRHWWIRRGGAIFRRPTCTPSLPRALATICTRRELRIAAACRMNTTLHAAHLPPICSTFEEEQSVPGFLTREA